MDKKWFLNIKLFLILILSILFINSINVNSFFNFKLSNTQNTYNYAQDRVLVKLKNNNSVSNFKSSLSSIWFKNVEILENINMWVLSFDKILKL